MKPTKAERQHSEALVFLHKNGVDINSITDELYRKALRIAAGLDKKIRDIEAYRELMYEAQESKVPVFFNGVKADRRKIFSEESYIDKEDLFDNNIAVSYTFNKDGLNIYIG